MNVNDLEFEATKDDVKQLRKWLEKAVHIPQDYDDKFLSAFIRGCKGNLRKTINVLENFNCLGMKCPEIFGNFDPFHHETQEHLETSKIFPLPRKTPEGSILFMDCVKEDEKLDPYKFHCLEYFRYWLQTFFIYLWENNFGSGKWTLIWNCTNITTTHMRDCTPVIVKSVVEIMQTSFPVRLQGFHVIAMPFILQWIFDMGKSMTKKKLVERIHFHSNMEEIYDYVAKEILPKEYGGDGESVKTLHNRWKKKVESYKKTLLEEEFKMRRLDTIRPKIDETEEMTGTFRKLDVE